jgi:hypothetical protein
MSAVPLVSVYVSVLCTCHDVVLGRIVCVCESFLRESQFVSIPTWLCKVLRVWRAHRACRSGQLNWQTSFKATN